MRFNICRFRLCVNLPVDLIFIAWTVTTEETGAEAMSTSRKTSTNPTRNLEGEMMGDE